MDKLCRIRDLQRAVHQFEAAFEKRYGICLNEGMTLCSLSKNRASLPGRAGRTAGPHALEHLESAPLGGTERAGDPGTLQRGPAPDVLLTHATRTRTARFGQLPGGGNTRNPARLALRVERDATKHSKRLSLRGQPFVISGRRDRYSRKWFSSLKAAANSLSDLRWRRCIATAPSSSFSRTQRSSSRCSK